MPEREFLQIWTVFCTIKQLFLIKTPKASRVMIQLYSLLFGIFCGYAYTFLLINSVKHLSSTALRRFSFQWLVRYALLGTMLYTTNHYFGLIISWWLTGFSIIFVWNLWQKTEVIS
jgi:hypothetical protein